MTQDDWLGRYRNIEGLQPALNFLSQKLSFENPLAEGLGVLKNLDPYLRPVFRELWPKLNTFHTEELKVP